MVQLGKVPDDADTKWTNVWLRIRPVIGPITLQLQAKAIQKPVELCQAAPNPLPWVLCISSFLEIFAVSFWSTSLALMTKDFRRRRINFWELHLPIQLQRTSPLLIFVVEACSFSLASSHLVIIRLLYSWSTTTLPIIFHIKKGFKLPLCIKWAVCQISLFFFSSISFLCGGPAGCLCPRKGVQGTVGFRISRLGFRIPCTVHVFVDGTCHLDSNRWWDSAGARTVFPDSEFYRQLNQEGRNLDSFTWGDTFYSNNI